MHNVVIGEQATFQPPSNATSVGDEDASDNGNQGGSGGQGGPMIKAQQLAQTDSTA